MRKLLVALCIVIPFFGFSQKRVTIKTAAELLASDNKPVLIDVRTPHEYDSVHIENAININYLSNDFIQKVNALDKKTPVLIYCRSGKRSYNAMNKMIMEGFMRVYDMEGGLNQWAKTYPNTLIRETDTKE